MIRRLAAPVPLLALTVLLATATSSVAVAGPAQARPAHARPAQAGPAEAGPQGDDAPHRAAALALPTRLDLPDGFLPEGIATGRGPFAFLGSRADGDIYRLNLRTGNGEVIAEGPGTPSVGLELDRRGRLFVSGGPAGDARVLDAWTGDTLATYQLTTDPSFVNDVEVTRGAAWFTDSQQPVLYRLPLGPRGGLPDAAETVPLTGEWEQVDGFNANGITSTPDHTGLLVVNSTTGGLFRVDPATGAATRVDLGGELLTDGDGMLLLGRTLYVVQNQQNQVAVIRLDRAGTTGRLVGTLTSPDVDVPTTAAYFAGALYLPNARFTTPQEPTTEFWVTRVPLRP